MPTLKHMPKIKHEELEEGLKVYKRKRVKVQKVHEWKREELLEEYEAAKKLFEEYRREQLRMSRTDKSTGSGRQHPL